MLYKDAKRVLPTEHLFSLTQLQTEITPKLEAKIVEMYYFRSAAIKQSLINDPLIRASQEVFQKNYSTILAGPAGSEKK